MTTKTVFGFWLYLLTDFVLFATILATYFVLRTTPHDLLPLSFTLQQGLLLLGSAFTAGLGEIFARKRQLLKTACGFGGTFLLGSAFLWMEMEGFFHLFAQGMDWTSSGLLSAYFSLLGTHAIHVLFGLLWILVVLPPLWMWGLNEKNLDRIECLRMFWQFLNLIWIGIFTLVYLT